MSGGAVCGQSEIGLGQTSSPAPPPQENAERKVMHCHSVRLPLAPSVGNDLRGQFFCAIETPLMLAPIRERRTALARDPGYVLDVLRQGTMRAQRPTQATLDELRSALGLFRLSG